MSYHFASRLNNFDTNYSESLFYGLQSRTSLPKEVNTVAEKRDQQQSQVQQAAGVLPMVRELRGAGWSFRRIADHLQSEGVPSPTRWKGKPTRWTVRTVKRLLEQAAPEDQPSSAESQPQSVTFTGPITVVATGTLRFLAPVTVNGPEPSKEETAPKRRPTGSIVRLAASSTCEAPHD